jgi:hypothetical protein
MTISQEKEVVTFKVVITNAGVVLAQTSILPVQNETKIVALCLLLAELLKSKLSRQKLSLIWAPLPPHTRHPF